MELQNKFEEIIENNGGCFLDYSNKKRADNVNIIQAAKECTKLCLEEQIKLIKSIYSLVQLPSLFIEYNKLEQQLKDLKNETNK